MKPRTDSKPSTSIQSVDRAMDILETLSSTKHGLSLMELAARCGLYTSTCHHLVQTLARRGYIEQDNESKRYALGNRVLHLQYGRVQQIDLAAHAHPVLQEVNDKTGEVLHLATLQGNELVTLLKLESTYPVRVDYAGVGKSHAAHATATGKAILAFREDARAALLNVPELRRFTDRTIVSVPALMEDLERIRRQGYALDDEEFQTGVYCIGVPVRNHTGQVVASISCSMPIMRVTRDRVEQTIKLMKDAGQSISERLGYSP